MNRTQLALEIGISRNALNSLVNNLNLEHIATLSLERICRTLNVTPNDLFQFFNEDGTVWKPEPIDPPLNEKRLHVKGISQQ